MNCTAVRDLLPEHALGVVGRPEAGTIDRHLATCAACRKEARDLERATATMAFTLAPAEPAPELADRVIGGLKALAGTAAGPAAQRRSSRRRVRRTTALVLAATLVVGGLGWVATAHRASRGAQATSIDQQHERALDAFRRLLRKSEFADPGTEVRLGLLAGATGAAGTGSAITILAPSQDDRVLVLLSGLVDGPKHLPYSVVLVNDVGLRLHVGRVDGLDTSGGATVARIFRGDLSGFSRIVVRDRSGRIVLRGTLETGAPVASPGP